jgi:hypothetical protein
LSDLEYVYLDGCLIEKADTLGYRPRSKIQRSPYFSSLEKYGILRHKWNDNINMDLEEILWEGVNWVHLT